MLAQNFKSAEDLGLTAEWHQALITVLGMMDRSEMVWTKPYKPAHNGFTMSHVWSMNDCETAGCIFGWARHLTRSMANNTSKECSREQEQALERLYMPPGYEHGLYTVEEAAHALRTYLVTGIPNWGKE